MPATAIRQPPRPAIPARQPGPRSSNLRLSKQFNDADRDRFLDEAFEFIERYFENSLAELSARNDGIEGRFKKLDGSRFTAVIYQHGTSRAQCTIVLGGGFGRSISYSDSAGELGRGFNEMLSIEHDDHHLFLRLLGMSTMGGNRENQLSLEGAAEHYWSMLIAPLQDA